MDNQHRKIKGYRELSQEEIDVMNSIKEAGASLGVLVESLEKLDEKLGSVDGEVLLDKRWLALGKTHLQQGLMCLTRAVAKPDFF